MAREVEVLAHLQVAGVPAILDHNMDSVEEIDTPLFFVSEWIDGPTLQAKVGGRPVPMEEAARIVRELTRIVGECHKMDIIHRDIKPDNMICESGTEKIYLVDFGLVHAPSLPNQYKTGTRQELGNRFFRIPDLGAGEDRRDPRTDITFVVGILFFLLTGRAPNHLHDSNGKPPHRRAELAFPKHILEDVRWRRIRSIFDVGFAAPVSHRFQDVSNLAEEIDEAMSYGASQREQQPAFEEELDLLVEARQRIDAAIDGVEQSLIELVNLLATNIAALCNHNGIKPVHAQAKMIRPGREAKMLWKVAQSNSSEPYVFLGLYAKLEGENSGEISIRLQTEPHEHVVSGTHVLHHGMAADTDRVREEIVAHASEAFAFAIRLLRNKIERST